MKIGIIIVGLGKIALTYDQDPLVFNENSRSSLGQAFQDSSKFELIAGVDPDRKAREQFERVLGVQTYADLQSIPPDLVNIVNAYVISVPTSVHTEILMSLSTLKCDPWILCEKPMGASIQEVQKIEQLFDIRKILVNYSRRFSNDIVNCEKHFKALIDESIESSAFLRCEVFGGTLRTGSHFLDLLSSWFGVEINRIENDTFIENTPLGLILNFKQIPVLYQDLNPNAEESYGVLTLELKDKSLTLVRDKLILKEGDRESVTEVMVNQTTTVNAFYELIASNGEINRCSFQDARKVHEIIDSMHRNL
jgi:predicted dehydrogenase